MFLLRLFALLLLTIDADEVGTFARHYCHVGCWISVELKEKIIFEESDFLWEAKRRTT